LRVLHAAEGENHSTALEKPCHGVTVVHLT